MMSFLEIRRLATGAMLLVFFFGLVARSADGSDERAVDESAAAATPHKLPDDARAHGPERYNVVWRSPSRDALGSMPLGNGEIGLNAWVEPSGDLLFYISRTDSWGDNGRLLKIGRVRVRIEPCPNTDERFRQELRLQDATLVARWGPEDHSVTLQLWVDANHPVVHVTIASSQPTTATASIELWRTERFELPTLEVSDVLLDRSRPDKKHAPTIVEPDTVLKNQTGRIGWYHHNVKSVGPALTAKIQGLSGFKRPDPLLHRTFGAIITAERAQRIDDRHLQSRRSTSHSFSIYVQTVHPASPEAWLTAMDRLIEQVEKIPSQQRRNEHEAWWAEFWNRSWIHVTESKPKAPPSLIPANTHPVRIGIDQHGANRLKGELGRVSIWNRPLREPQIKRLSSLDPDRPLPDQPGVLFTGVPKIADALESSKSWSFSDGLTIEVWVRPEKLTRGGGRLVDKLTPGGSDGFLLDTYPGNSVRLIVGRHTIGRRKALPPGRWSHVVAVVDNRTGWMRLYVDGQQVATTCDEPLDDALIVSRGYALQRFLTACAGRGRYPIKFNGSIFTVPWPGRAGDADYRRWGPGYWWQNTRLPYYAMCAAGDFEMMQPLFQMYGRDLMPLFQYRTRLYFGHNGAFIPECIYFWGDVFSETYGWTPFEQRGEDKLQTSRWHKWEWVSGLELVWLMLDYYDYTLDREFLRSTALPAAHEILTFFDQHYRLGPDGKLIMHPAQSLETWWDCTNPMPEIAGLHAITQRLLRLPADLTMAEQRAFWKSLRAKLPDLPTREVDGVRMFAPAERYAMKHNIENPELYVVFPFRLAAFEKPNAQLAIEALRHRWNKGNRGWRQDDTFMAYLGLTDEARQYLVGRSRQSCPDCRFPAFWGPNYDWVPDQTHGAVLMTTLQSMLLQTDGRKVFLLPAWPKDWNVRFKLHAPGRATIECEYRDGTIRFLNIIPRDRQRDVVVCPLKA
ncbi:MAG: LamG domain-containing protein, partial [Planctomycetes bacterium]|nr:LamG domain-containing protein [Planctomycetota bacterium]